MMGPANREVATQPGIDSNRSTHLEATNTIGTGAADAVIGDPLPLMPPPPTLETATNEVEGATQGFTASEEASQSVDDAGEPKKKKRKHTKRPRDPEGGAVDVQIASTTSGNNTSGEEDDKAAKRARRAARKAKKKAELEQMEDEAVTGEETIRMQGEYEARARPPPPPHPSACTHK